jgi:hypothetical protein
MEPGIGGLPGSGNRLKPDFIDDSPLISLRNRGQPMPVLVEACPRMTLRCVKAFRPQLQSRCRGWGALLAATLAIVSPALAQGKGDADLCAIAAPADVQRLITSQDVEIRAVPGDPAPGEITCTWGAYQKGLTADAPPEGRLSLARYTFANVDKARAQMRRLAETAQPPSLVRTADADDQIVRQDGDGAIARHGVVITVIDGSEVRDNARQRADWTYRIEALALQAAGAQVLGPANDRATTNVCHLVAPDHVLPLLTLTRSSLTSRSEESDNGKRCSFSVKDASGKIDGWVNNDGDAQFTREDLGTNAAALARQHQDTPFFPPSKLVSTTEASDRVVPNPERPEEVEAVHGPYLVTLNLTGVTPAARAHPTWAYRVQRAALEAAGATIVAPADMAADPVVAGPTPPPPPQQPVAWQPANQPAPASNVLIDWLLHIGAVLARWRFLVLPASILGPILFGVLVRRHVWLVPLLIIAGVVNMVFGTEIMTILIYRFGATGRATVTGSFATGTVYNNHNVRGHDVLIRTAGGSVVETSFRDDDFNVYPPHNSVTYPGQGDEFSVRYLQNYPTDFIIVAGDDSPWARGLSCASLRRDVAQADNKRQFAPDQVDYRKAYAAAIAAARAQGCSVADDSDQ